MNQEQERRLAILNRGKARMGQQFGATEQEGKGIEEKRSLASPTRIKKAFGIILLVLLTALSLYTPAQSGGGSRSRPDGRMFLFHTGYKSVDWSRYIAEALAAAAVSGVLTLAGSWIFRRKTKSLRNGD